MALERNLKIFEALSAGPATLPYLHGTVFRKTSGELVSRQVFERYIRRLSEDEYIQVLKIRETVRKTGSVRVAVLKERGADILCRVSNFERDHIRMRIPRKYEWYHDFVLAEVIRSIRNEAANKKSYTIEYLYDDVIIKSKAHQLQRGLRKNVYYPDLRVRIHPKMGSPVSLNIEVDTGNKKERYWRKKIESWTGANIVITMTSERLDRLTHYAQTANLRGVMCFSTMSDFLRSGLTYWIAALSDVNEAKIFSYQ